MNFRILLGALGVAALTGTAGAGPSAGVSVSVGDPNFYGRIDIGRVPAPPVLVYDQPVTIVQRPVRQQPIYLRVPPGHERNWRKHCRKYDACGQPVYFVQDRWYQEHYAHRQERRDDRRDAREDRRDDRHQGHGRGRGHD